MKSLRGLGDPRQGDPGEGVKAGRAGLRACLGVLERQGVPTAREVGELPSELRAPGDADGDAAEGEHAEVEGVTGTELKCGSKFPMADCHENTDYQARTGGLMKQGECESAGPKPCRVRGCYP